MEQRNIEQIEIDIKELLMKILRKWWLIAIFGIVGAIGARMYTLYLVTPFYSSTSMVYAINRQNGETTTMSDLQFGMYIAQDLKILVKSGPVTEEVIRRLNIDISPNQLAALTTVRTSSDTRFMYITVSHPVPQVAKLLVDEVAAVSSECMVSVMQMEKVDIVEEGKIPRYPSSPNIMKNMIIGGLLGMIIIAGLIMIINLLSDTIKSSEDIEKYLGITTLGIIPLEQAAGKKGRKHKQNKRVSREALAS